jgi:E3 ubiquitin-protein ligase HUWE1
MSPRLLTVIQEAGVPEAFYRAVEAGLEPVIEVSEDVICQLTASLTLSR